jgi:hypothetical protein
MDESKCSGAFDTCSPFKDLNHGPAAMLVLKKRRMENY